ncbi:MAG TPA: TonB-dependent receptor [Candidatus Angelobacter sp.]|nr:TonB-dependent receptor [Candidatus Angelobacter sp.]
MSKRYPAIAAVGCLLLLCSMNLFGQATASSGLQGTIIDKTQAAVAGASVTITNKATGETRSTKADASGEYRFTLLPAGIYNLKVNAPSFSTTEARDVELLVGNTSTQNFTLSPGAVNETVEVTAVAPLVDQEKTDVGLTITPEQVQELPLNGRDFGNLAYLAPGAKPVDSYDPTKNRISIFGINGSSGRNVNVTVNGVDNKDNTVGGPVMQLPLEAVQEFNISTQRFSAANGRSEGAAINVITKSGTNAYHGAVYGFFRDQALNANDFFSKQAGADTPPYSRQQFGGSFGGPIVKDRFFGFFAYERQREHTSLPESPQTFQELSLITNSAALQAGGLGTPQIASVIPTPYFDTRYNGRLDYRFNDRHSAYLSYASQGNNSQNDQSAGKSDLTAGNFTTNQLQIANLTVSSILSNNVVNQATLGFQYWNNLISTNSFTPTITFSNLGFSYGTNTNVPQQSFQRKFQFKDDLSFVHGRHSFKTGFDYLWEPVLGGFFEFNPTLEIDFTGTPSQILADPQGFAKPGLVQGMSATAGDPTFIIGTKMFGLYFQDDWKLTNRLSLNLGMRWDKDFNLIGGTAVANSRTFQELRTINSPLAASLPHDDNLDFSPRVGFAFDITGSGKHLLRGGYGIYYGQVFENIPLFMIQQQNATIFQTSFSISNPTDIVPGTGIQLQNWHVGNPLPVLPGPSAKLNPGSVGRLMDPNYRNPYSETWNFGYSWQLSKNSVIEAEYVHELGVHESKTINVDQAFAGGPRPLDAALMAAGQPVLSRIDDEQAIGRSRYDGMNLSYRQRMWKHFSVNANYTLARAVAYAGNAAAFRNRPTISSQPFRQADFGPVPNDELHHVTISAIADLPYGIRIAPIMIFGSSRPYNPILGYDALGVGAGRGNEPIVVDNSNPTNLTRYQGKANAAAVRTCLAANTCREVGFDAFRGDPFFQLDTRVSKIIKLGERTRLELLTQLFNLTNRANFGNNFDGNVNDFSPNPAKNTFMQPIGYINPSSTVIPRAFSAEFGFRFSF